MSCIHNKNVENTVAKVIKENPIRIANHKMEQQFQNMIIFLENKFRIASSNSETLMMALLICFY